MFHSGPSRGQVIDRIPSAHTFLSERVGGLRWPSGNVQSQCASIYGTVVLWIVTKRDISKLKRKNAGGAWTHSPKISLHFCGLAFKWHWYLSKTGNKVIFTHLGPSLDTRHRQTALQLPADECCNTTCSQTRWCFWLKTHLTCVFAATV